MSKNLAFFLPAVFLSTSLYAQTTGAGTITGTITDPSGAVIPAASVAVKNTATQAERALTTHEAGISVASSTAATRSAHWAAGLTRLAAPASLQVGR